MTAKPENHTHSPRVSILIPFYNSEKYLPETINSILSQSYSDFELILCDDCSTDNSAEVVRSFDDPRIRLISNKVNMQQGPTRNKLIGEARGEYCIMFDSDDIFMPDRIKKQADYLDSHPEVDYCTGILVSTDENGSETGVTHYHDARKHKEIKVRSLFHCPQGHTTAMFRLDKYRKNNITYTTEYKYASDLDMHLKAIQVLRYENMLEPVCTYRQHGTQISNTLSSEQLDSAVEIMAANHRKQLGIETTVKDRKAIRNFLLWEAATGKEIRNCKRYIFKLLKADKTAKKYDTAEFKKHAIFLFSSICQIERGKKQRFKNKNYLTFKFFKLKLKRY